MYVFDATAHIYLAKTERLDLVENLPRRCVIPEEVYDEVVTRGLEEDHADARRIDRVVEDGTLDVRSAPETETLVRLADNDRLSSADAAVLAVAEANDGTAVMDEQYGRDVADVEGITTKGAAYLVLWLLREGHVAAPEARDIIDSMLDAGWYCSPDLYAKIRQKIEEMSG